MELRKVTERIYYLPATSETDRPVLGYIKGDRYNLMVDAGNSASHVELFHEAIKQYGLPAPDYVAITHWHWDHTFGMCAVNGKTIACRKTNLELEKVAGWDWSDAAMEERLQTGEDIAFCDRCIRLEYSDRNRIDVRLADIVFENELTIDLGGIHCQLIRIGGTHSDDSVIVYIPEEKVVFTGDADGADYYHNNGKYDKSKLVQIMKDMNGLDAAVFIAGHDEPISKEEVMMYLREELDKLS